MRTLRWFLIALVALLFSAPLSAQDDDEQTYDVWVTTQDFSVLREGPSREFEKIVTVDSALTMPAIGRTLQGDWLQVIWTSPEGEEVQGWIASWLLIWTGNILELPVDGIDPEPFARRTGPTIILEPGTYYYRDAITLDNQVRQTVTEPTLVELTGRIGALDNGNFIIQFRLDGEYYITGSWALALPYDYRNVADASYIYVFGRLREQLESEISSTRTRLSSIRRRWSDLANGQPVGCRLLPIYATFSEDNLSEDDVARESIYRASVNALIRANANINDAVQRFRDVCAIPAEERLIGPDVINPALAAINTAENNLTLAEIQLPGLQQQDPLLGGNN